MGGASVAPQLHPKVIGSQSAGGMIKPAKEEKFVGFGETGRNGDSGPSYKKSWLRSAPLPLNSYLPESRRVPMPSSCLRSCTLYTDEFLDPYRKELILSSVQTT